MKLQKHLDTLELPKVLRLLADECGSNQAAQAALDLTPAETLEQAQHLLKQTEDAYILTARFGAPSFGGLCDISGALARAVAGGMLNPAELLEIAGCLRAIRVLLDWRSRSQGVETVLDDIFGALSANKFLEEKITGAILSEDEISDTASPTLADIRRKMKAASARAREKLDSMVRSPVYQKYLQDAIVTIRDGRFVVPVKAECRGEVAGLVHDTSSTGATVFIEPMAVVEANNDVKVLRSKEAAEIERILFELSEQAGSFAESIKTSCAAMVKLDLIFAKARLAYSMKASVPTLNNRGVTVLRRVRHPLLDKKTVVPVDITLGGEYDTLVITGPNTGGKTVTLKSLGLLTLMAACGLMLPVADKSEVAFYNKVLADIGDEQSIEQSLSTFSSHIKNIISILDAAGDDTLVLLDELCAGTDPVEGAALAISILETLRSRDSKIAATTHYAELKAYALDTKGVENACCEFDVATLSPTYKLLIGVPGRSNAFAISERLGLPAEVVNSARENVSAESTRFEQVVAGLEASRIALEEQREEAERARAEAEKIRARAQQQEQDMREKYEAEMEKARGTARVMADNARVQVNRMLDELEQLKKSESADRLAKARAAAKQGFSALDKISGEGEAFYDDYVLPRELQIGDTVLIVDYQKKATVLSLPDSGGNVEVQAGSMKTRVKADRLRLCAPEKAKKERTPKRTAEQNSRPSRATREVRVELDLRGQNVEEGLLELDRFIDNAVLSGIGQFTVIHGKGTGVLRRGVQDFLRHHKAVRSYRLGVFGEGEAGVTVVELK